MDLSDTKTGPHVCIIVAALFALGGLGCNTDLSPGERMAAKTIQQVQQEHTDAWMAIPGVVGTAIGQRGDTPCILVLAASESDQIRRKIPATVEGYPVVIEYTGEIRALDGSPQ
jgi:hypothetical protein